MAGESGRGMAARRERELDEAILSVCRGAPGGRASVETMQARISGVTVEEIRDGLNRLLQTYRLVVMRGGNTDLYKAQAEEAAQKFKGLGVEELLVYQTIQASKDMGIWTKDLKVKSNLQQPAINKILKKLEGRQLIKEVRSVQSKNRKVYMSFEVEPSAEITGGAWYTEQEFDNNFINTLQRACLKHINEKRCVSIEDIHAFVRRSGVSKVELKVDDIQSIVDTLVFDGLVEELEGSGVGGEDVVEGGAPPPAKAARSSAGGGSRDGKAPVADGVPARRVAFYVPEKLKIPKHSIISDTLDMLHHFDTVDAEKNGVQALQTEDQYDPLVAAATRARAILHATATQQQQLRDDLAAKAQIKLEVKQEVKSEVLRGR